MFEIKNLSFGYTKKHTVLKDISFKAEQGECVGILGVNGVGKSTLLKCVINALKPSTGEILMDGVDIAKLKPSKRARLIGYVPQSVYFANTNVYDAILVGRKPYFSYDAKEHDLDIVDDVINRLNLNDLAFKNVNNLSGGERQKIALARALVQEPQLLYLDEPTSNLDIANQISVLEMIKDVAQRENIIVLCNIHNINLALHYFKRLVILKDGEVFKIVDENNELTSEDLKIAFGIDCTIQTIDEKKYIVLKEKKK